MSKLTRKQLERAIQRQESRIDGLVGLLAKKGYYDKEPKPQLKQLDQSVFDELDEKWRFAAVDSDGVASYYDGIPEIRKDHFIYLDAPNGAGQSYRLSGTYDASNWQNSLIERDIAKELLEVDLSIELTGSELCKAMLERGDRFVMCMAGDGTDVIYDLACFVSSTHPYIGRLGNYRAVMPINNQGEPLTARDVGL